MTSNAYHMSKDIKEFPELRVHVDNVILMPNLEGTEEKPHAFVYFISIFNTSDIPVTLRGRKWVVLEDDGETTVVEGDGVVGQQPLIEPGNHFSYNSYHIVARSAVVNGSFFAQKADGEWVFARIPEFRLALPEGV